MSDPPKLDHLLDPDPNALPDLPVPSELPERTNIEAGSGINVSQLGDSALISAQPSLGFGSGGGLSVFVDPLATVSYRAKLIVEDDIQKVSIVTSYINDVYYDAGWMHESFAIPAEKLAISVFPQFLYFNLPVVFIGANLDDVPSSDFPINDFSSTPQTVNGSPYVFSTIQTTAYITRDRTAAPDSYYFFSPVTVDGSQIIVGPDGNGTGFWRFLIAEITEGGVFQYHLGALMMPQAFNFKIVDLTVT